MTYVLSAHATPARVEAHAGGKGASLARLVDLGVNVPAFFVLSTRAFRDFDRTEFSAAFVEEVREAYAALGEGAVAVRSSAIGEDAPTASHAGIYDTRLNVTGVPALLDAIRACWQSYRTATAEHYRSEHRVLGEAAMAVVVQRFVPADWSGVTFTADPVHGALTRMVMNITPGVGEALVSGHVSPEEIVLDRATGAVLNRSLGDHPVPAPDSLLRQVWEQAVAIADAWDGPQDVEWAAVGSGVAILQSRPIPTVAAIYVNRALEPWRTTPEAADDPGRLWSRAYADEIWSSPTSPLFYDVQNLSGSFAAWRAWHHDSRPASPAVFKYFKAAAYVDLEILRQKYEFHPRMARVAGILNFFPRVMQEEVRRAPFRWRGRLRRHLHFEFQDRRQRSIRNTYRHLDTLWPDFTARSDTWFELDVDGMSLDELRAHHADVMQEFGRVGIPCGYAVAYHAHDLTFFLTGLLDRWFGDGAALYATVSSGLEGSAAVDEADEIWRIAEQLRAAGPAAVAAVENADWVGLQRRQNGDDPGVSAAFMQDFLAFWRTHLHRGASYKDLIYPRWGDQPHMLLDLVKGYLHSPSQRPRLRNLEQAERRQAMQEELFGRLRGPLGPLRRTLLRTLFRYNEIYMGVRDEHRFYFDRNWYALRQIYRSYGRRLAEDGVIAAADDVFFLGTREIDAGLAGNLPPDRAQQRIAVRRREWEETLRHQAPKFLQGWTPIPDDIPGAGRGGGQIQGIAASPGIARGHARVLHTIDELATLADGEILVTRQTDPGWTPVFPRIAGLVLETGGVLAHGTSLCREYGLPCVTAVEDATEQISTGDWIEIDGASGQIRLEADLSSG